MPSSRKRAAAVDLPMPIDPVSPMTSIRRLRTSCRDHVATAQLGQQRQERQPDNGEVVALNALKQLDAAAFDLIAANRAQDSGSSSGEVVVEPGIAEGTHMQGRDLDAFPNDAAGLGQ